MKERFKFKCLLPKEEAQNLWRETRQKLGDKLRRLRQEQRLLICDISDSLGISVDDLDSMENGEGFFRLDVFRYLCRFYGVRPILTLEYISGIDGNREAELAEAEFFRSQHSQEDDNVE